MTLYHATLEKFSDDIEVYGLEPSLSTKISNDERLNIEAVFGFVSKEDAINFAIDNCWDSFSIFVFDSNGKETIIDTEYDGESIAVITDDPIPCKIIMKYDHGEICNS